MAPTSTFINSFNGYKLHRVLWDTPTAPVAQVVLIHGFGEHALRYTSYFEQFIKAGIRCASFDLYGHGSSDGKRGDILDYQHFLIDVDQVLKMTCDEFPDIPVFLYGHSMGGNILLRYLERYNPTFISGAIVASPWIKLTHNPNPVLQAVIKILSAVAPHASMSSGLDIRYLSRIESQVQLYKTDPLVHGRISFKLLHQIIENGKLTIHQAYKIEQNVLLLHGLNDKITSPKASAKVAKANKRFITLKTIKGAYHELHNDVGSAELADDILQWMRSHFSKPKNEF